MRILRAAFLMVGALGTFLVPSWAVALVAFSTADVRITHIEALDLDPSDGILPYWTFNHGDSGTTPIESNVALIYTNVDGVPFLPLVDRDIGPDQTALVQVVTPSVYARGSAALGPTPHNTSSSSINSAHDGIVNWAEVSSSTDKTYTGGSDYALFLNPFMELRITFLMYASSAFSSLAIGSTEATAQIFASNNQFEVVSCAGSQGACAPNALSFQQIEQTISLSSSTGASQFVAFGMRSSSDASAMLSVPEPSTLSLATVGLIGLTVLVRRRGLRASAPDADTGRSARI